MSQVKISLFAVNETMKLGTGIYYPDNVQNGMDTGRGTTPECFSSRLRKTHERHFISMLPSGQNVFTFCQFFSLRCFKNSLIVYCLIFIWNQRYL